MAGSNNKKKKKQVNTSFLSIKGSIGQIVTSSIMVYKAYIMTKIWLLCTEDQDLNSTLNVWKAVMIFVYFGDIVYFGKS